MACDLEHGTGTIFWSTLVLLLEGMLCVVAIQLQ